MTVRAARRKNLRALWRLRESWRGGKKNSEKRRHKFHESARHCM
jgi:hypothetical protein